MKKTILTLVLILAMCLSMVVGCAGGTTEEETTESTTTETTETASTDDSDTTEEEAEEELEVLTVTYLSDRSEMAEDNLLADVLMEKFSIELDYWGTTSDAETELPLMCASGEYPDWFYGDTGTSIEQLAYDGYFLNIYDYIDLLPNYKALYTDEQWEEDVAYRAYDDGNLYYIPQKRAWTSVAGWLYRSDLFEENGIEVPTNLEELYDVCAQWKEIYEDSLPLVNKYQYVKSAVEMAYGAFNGLNPESGEYVAYYQVEDSYREALIYLNSLYEAGYVDPEFMTASSTQFKERFASSLPAMTYGSVVWETSCNTYTLASDDEINADPDWQYTETFITATADDEYTYYEGLISAQLWGSFFTDKMLETEGLAERMFEFVDWMCTEEGIEWVNWGVEGVTFEVDDSGSYSYLTDNVNISNSNENANTLTQWGIITYTYWSPEAITSSYQSDAWLTMAELVEETESAYDFTNRIKLTLTEDQVEAKGDYEALLETVCDEYTLKFIFGTLDASDDDDWNAYLSALDDSGVYDYIDLITGIYEEQYE